MPSHGSASSAALDIGSPRNSPHNPPYWNNSPPSSNPFFNSSVPFPRPPSSNPFFSRSPPPANYEAALCQQERQATQWPKIWKELLSGTLFERDWLLWRSVAGQPGHPHPNGLSFSSEGPGGYTASVTQGPFLGPYRSQKFSLLPNYLNPTPSIPDWSRILSELQDHSLLIPTTEPSSLPMLARIWWHEQQGPRFLLNCSSSASLRACGRTALALGDAATLLHARRLHDDLDQCEEEISCENYDSDQETYFFRAGF